MADRGSPTANRLALLGKDAELALEYLQTLGSVLGRQPDLMALHMRVIEARDTMIAHSDWDKRRSVVIGRHGPGAGGGAPGEHAELGSRAVLRSTTMAQGWEGIDAAAFSRLASLVREQAERLAFDLERLR